MLNKERAERLKIVLRNDEYWIVNHKPEMGPYEFKHQAASDLKGVQWFYLNMAVEDTEEESLLEDILS